MALTEKQKRFVDEYLADKDMNATRAYLKVYKNCKSEDVAAAASSRLLRNVKVSEYIDMRMEERSKRTEITQDWVLEELRKIASANATDFSQIVEEPVTNPNTGQVTKYQTVKFVPTKELPEEKRAAISSIKETKFGISMETYDRVKALELLGRHLGMFKDKVEVSGLENEKSKLDDLIQQICGDDKE